MTMILTVAAALAFAAPAAADDVDVIASGLDNPRNVAVAPGGDVYVAEAGRGGDHSAQRSCFNSPEGFACTGATGAVTRISDNRTKRVVRGLASFAPAGGNNAIGPHGVFASRDGLVLTNGGPTAPTREGEDVLRDPTLVREARVSALYGTVLKVGRRGKIRKLADPWRYERDVNPDEELGNPRIDSNPAGVLADRGGYVIADAGGNTLLRASRRGAIRALSLFPNIGEMNAVPTGVARGRDGSYYVSQLTGVPFPVGGASVFRVDPRSGEYTTYATGFTNAIDLDFGRDGTLYVLEIDRDSLAAPGRDGGLWAVPPGGGTPRRIELPAGTLTEPGGIAVGRRGALYVSNHAREAGAGEVLRIDLD
jgi:hypothetical protein